MQLKPQELNTGEFELHIPQVIITYKYGEPLRVGNHFYCNSMTKGSKPCYRRVRQMTFSFLNLGCKTYLISYNLQTWRPLQAHWAPLQIMRQLWHRALLHLQQTLLDLEEQVVLLGDPAICSPSMLIL